MMLMAQAAASQLLADQPALQLAEGSIPGPLVLPPLTSSPEMLPSLCCSLDMHTGVVGTAACARIPSQAY